MLVASGSVAAYHTSSEYSVPGVHPARKLIGRICPAASAMRYASVRVTNRPEDVMKPWVTLPGHRPAFCASRKQGGCLAGGGR